MATYNDEKHKVLEGEEHIEVAGRRNSLADEITELSSIEATAASKAAWLISVTVSLGGFLFGYVVLAFSNSLAGPY